MKTFRHIFQVLFLTACLLVSGVLVHAQADFSRFYVIGDSLTAGYSHGSLVQTFQQYSYPALIAQQAGVDDFEQPLISEPGIPARLVLLHLVPSVVIGQKTGLGTPINLTLPRPYNNLAVPGANVYDVLNTVSGGLHDVILRGQGTQLQQFIVSNPTFAVVWIGNNDLLGSVIYGKVIEGVTVTPLSFFVDQLQGLINGIRLASDADVVFLTLPDPTVIPYTTTIPPYIVNPATGQPVLDDQGNPIPLLGPNGPLPPNSLVTLPASALLAEGYGIPKALGGNGLPLPDDVVLLPGEIDQIRSILKSFNNEIRSRAEDAGFKVFDSEALITQLSETGVLYGGIHLTFDYLTGGMFSYDGVHPSPLGYAVFVNYLIEFINQEFGNELPLIDLKPFITGEKGGVPVEGTILPNSMPIFTQQAYESLKSVFPLLNDQEK